MNRIALPNQANIECYKLALFSYHMPFPPITQSQVYETPFTNNADPLGRSIDED